MDEIYLTLSHQINYHSLYLCTKLIIEIEIAIGTLGLILNLKLTK